MSEQIGNGYTSKVYKGYNSITNEVVAIKVINIHSIQSKFHYQLL